MKKSIFILILALSLNAYGQDDFADIRKELEPLYKMQDSLVCEIQKHLDELLPVGIEIEHRFFCKYVNNLLFLPIEPISLLDTKYVAVYKHWIDYELKYRDFGKENVELVDGYFECLSKLSNSQLLSQYRACSEIISDRISEYMSEYEKKKTDKMKNIIDNFMQF